MRRKHRTWLSGPTSLGMPENLVCDNSSTYTDRSSLSAQPDVAAHNAHISTRRRARQKRPKSSRAPVTHLRETHLITP
eukprot:scaffold1311_cov256-Pinguiococcus_pyrenoidosus.AAC.50